MKSHYLLTQFGFAAVTLAGYAILIWLLRRALPATSFTVHRQRRMLRLTVLALAGWLVLTAVLSATGVLSKFNTFPPRLFVVLLVPLVVIILVVRSKAVKEILAHIPPQHLLYLQSFRVVVEILLWMLFIDNLAPVQMTFEGRNLDVLSGLTAPIVGYLYSRGTLSKGVVVFWNVACLGLLINIVTVAVLSMPTPMRVFMNEPANTIVAAFPVVWLPALLVPLAYGLHFLSLRQLMGRAVSLQSLPS